MIYKCDCTQEQWKAFIKVMRSGQQFEIDKKMYFYWLETHPPIFMNERVNFLPGHEGRVVDFGFAEGAEEITFVSGVTETGILDREQAKSILGYKKGGGNGRDNIFA